MNKADGFRFCFRDKRIRGASIKQGVVIIISDTLDNAYAKLLEVVKSKSNIHTKLTDFALLSVSVL